MQEAEEHDSPITRSLTVTEHLRDMLLNGEFAPETRLQEVTLAAKMNVSRTPVREALRILAKDGLLIYAPNRGYMVRRFTLEDLVKAFRVRSVLEGLGARMAAERGLDDATEQVLQGALDEAEALLLKDLKQEDNFKQWRLMNRRFHNTILTHADNDILVRCTKHSRSIPIVFNGSFKWYQCEDFRRSQWHHEAIFDAIKNRQGERADRMMQEHIYSATEILKACYRDE